MNFIKNNWKNVAIFILSVALTYMIAQNRQNDFVNQVMNQNAMYQQVTMNVKTWVEKNVKEENVKDIFRQLGINVAKSDTLSANSK